MTNRYQYEFKKFTSGKRKGQVYVNIRSVKTGKTIRTVSSKENVQTANKSHKQQIRRAEDKAFDDQLQETAKKHHANYRDIKQRYTRQVKVEKQKEKERVKQKRKKGKKPYGRKLKTLKTDVLDDIDKSCGYVTTWRLFWVVQIAGDSPYVEAQGAEAYEGDEFDNAKSIVKDISLPIIHEAKTEKDYNILDNSGSGACVRLIDRETQQTVRHFELGVGCVRI